LKKIEHDNKKLWLQLECVNLRGLPQFLFMPSLRTEAMPAHNWRPDGSQPGRVKMCFSGCAGLMRMTTSNLSGWKKKCNE